MTRLDSVQAMKVTAAKVRTWGAIQVYDHHMPEDLARLALADAMLVQVDDQGYEPAPGEVPVILDGDVAQDGHHRVVTAARLGWHHRPIPIHRIAPRENA